MDDVDRDPFTGELDGEPVADAAPAVGTVNGPQGALAELDELSGDPRLRTYGHTDLGTTSTYLQGIDPSEIIDAVRTRRPPTIPATAGLTL